LLFQDEFSSHGSSFGWNEDGFPQPLLADGDVLGLNVEADAIAPTIQCRNGGCSRASERVEHGVSRK
jgi:hypothetical protein